MPCKVLEYPSISYHLGVLFARVKKMFHFFSFCNRGFMTSNLLCLYAMWWHPCVDEDTSRRGAYQKNQKQWVFLQLKNFHFKASWSISEQNFIHLILDKSTVFSSGYCMLKTNQTWPLKSNELFTKNQVHWYPFSYRYPPIGRIEGFQIYFPSLIPILKPLKFFMSHVKVFPAFEMFKS